MGLWRSLELFSIQSGVREEWRREMGTDFEACSRFLAPSSIQVENYPCTNPVRCHCRHRIVYESEESLLAVCECADGGCDSILLGLRDVIVYTFDSVKMGAALREAFGFHGSVALHSNRRAARQIGTWKDLRTPVFFYVPISEDGTVREIERLETAASDPYVLLTPSNRFCGPRVQGALRRNGSVQLGLSGIVKVKSCGALRVAEEAAATLDTVFGEIERRRFTRPDATLWLKEIHREISSVRAEFHETRAAKARLEEMQAQGLFKFTQKVDPKSFKVLCAILSEGDIAKASRALETGDSTLRDIIAGWPRRGPAYATMADLVRWRKSIGRASTVPLNDAVLTERADTVDYPGIISDVLDGILSMTDANWEDKAQELAEMLRPAARS